MVRTIHVTSIGSHMIRIKAPRVWVRLSLEGGPWKKGTPIYEGKDMRYLSHPDDRAGRWITETMHRRVVALVRACEDDTSRIGLPRDIHDALAALRAQAEKEAGK